jgi:hypothetical protein
VGTDWRLGGVEGEWGRSATEKVKKTSRPREETNPSTVDTKISPRV